MNILELLQIKQSDQGQCIKYMVKVHGTKNTWRTIGTYHKNGWGTFLDFDHEEFRHRSDYERYLLDQIKRQMLIIGEVLSESGN